LGYVKESNLEMYIFKNEQILLKCFK